VLLVALVAGGLFLLTRALDGGATPAVSATPAAGEHASAPVANTAELAAPANTDTAASAGVRAPAAVLGGDSTREENFALDGAHWLSGRVNVPANAPQDETLAVWALDLDGGERGSAVMFGNSDDPGALLEALRDEQSATRWARRLVGADGTFRVPVPADSAHAVLVLDGRYLFLDERVDVDLAHPTAELVLEAQLGAWLVVRCTPPAGAASADLAASGDAAVGGFSMSGGKNGGRFVQRKATLDAACGFESRGLPPLHYGISVAPRRFASARARDVDAAAGKKVELELVLTRGATVRGRVLDDSGAAVAGAVVRAHAADRGRGGMMDWTTNLVGERRVDSAADGSFELAALTPGKLSVLAEHAGFVAGDTGELELADGAVLADVVVRLSRGGGVAGTVTFPDGKPAARASVTVYEPATGGKRRRDLDGESHSTATEADGSFALTGLGAGPYRVVAHHAERADPSDPDEAAANAAIAELNLSDDVPIETNAVRVNGKVVRIDTRVWLATREDVAANSQSLALVLQPPPGLAGRVVDEKGAPIRRFIASAIPDWGSGTVLDRSVHALAVEGETGEFALGGVPAGTWRVSIEAEGYVQAGEKPLAVVPLAQELVVTLGSAGKIRGIVVDPLGQPVAKARVTRHASGDKNPWARVGRDEGATSDAQGAFVIDEVSAGTWELSASAEAWAKSAATPVMVESGADVSGIVVTLRRGGTITGEVFAAAGEHVAGRTVQMFSLEAGDSRSATVDEKQRFTSERVTPGAYQVVLQPDMSALEALADAGGEDANPADFLAKMKMTSCTVVEGETTHVVLGAPPKNPVRVFGRITRGGEPVPKCALVVLNEGADMMQNLRFGKVDADGRYEVTLNLPGDVVFVVGKQIGDNSGVEFPLTIPEVAEYQCDLALPSGGIRGTVRGSDGRPLANVTVELSRDQATGVMMMGGMPSETTDEAGRYAFDDLHAGTYTVAAGGSSAQMFGGGAAAENGRALRAGLVVDGKKALDGIDFVLGGAGTIAGVVKDARGAPVSGAVVFARDAAGELVHRLSGVSSDAAGKFSYPGLAEGRYTLFARAQALAGRESSAVEVRAGETAKAELALDAGTLLVITLTDADDKPLRASLSVVDEHGREVSQATSLLSVMATMTTGVNTREHRFGPLPAGKYVVTARTEDGKSAKKSVSLSGQEERKLRVRVD
jgi:hypothetical protein